MLRFSKTRLIMTPTEAFKDKSVIVTGAGSGIGRAAAIQFAKQGAKVLVAELNEKTASDITGVVLPVDGGWSAV